MGLDGWAWAKYYDAKRKQQNEDKKKTKSFVFTQIEWKLSQDLLPVTSKSSKSRSGYVFVSYYLNGNRTTQEFIYVLQDIENNVIRYVGKTHDPARRYMEHQRNQKVGLSFKMTVVDMGDHHTESHWIAKCRLDGCDLLNKQQIGA